MPLLQAKLGNSSVSPNVGHLILKYLCPAIREILNDGLKAYVLDLIIGQRKNHPWSVVEASTQLGMKGLMIIMMICYPDEDVNKKIYPFCLRSFYTSFAQPVF